MPLDRLCGTAFFTSSHYDIVTRRDSRRDTRRDSGILGGIVGRTSRRDTKLPRPHFWKMLLFFFVFFFACLAN